MLTWNRRDSTPLSAAPRAPWCDRQQQWKAVITGDTVTRLSIPIRGRGKSPEEVKFGRNVVKKEKKYQDEEKSPQ